MSRLPRDDVYLYISFRFFETESIAVITMLMSRYSVEVEKEPEFIGEIFEQRYSRVTGFDLGLTNAWVMFPPSRSPVPEFSSSPLRVPLVFKRR